MLWKEERKHRLNCCNNDKYTVPALKPVPPELMNTFRSKSFKGHRDDNGLCSFTALGAGGVDKRSWTQPDRGPGMFTLHGKTYHRIFDLQQLYEDMNVSNSGRPNLNDPSSPTPYIEFADVSRINDGPVLGEQVSAPDIAALVLSLIHI